MVAAGLLLTAALAATAGALFVSVGLLVGRRQAGSGRVAQGAYAVGWMSLGGVLWSDAGRLVLGLTPEPSVAAYLSLVWLKIVLTGIAIAGFGAYILYAWTGSRLALPVAVAAGLVHMLFWMVSTNRTLPGEVHVGTWATRMAFQGSGIVPGGQAFGAAMFFVPLLAIAVAYMAFWRQVSTSGQRFRLAMVGLSLIVFLLTAAVQGNPQIDPDTPVLPLNLLVACIAAVGARVAFAPPSSWRQRFGIDTYAPTR